MENQITCYEAQMLPKLKVTGKFMEEISCSPSAPRLEPVKLQPNRNTWTKYTSGMSVIVPEPPCMAETCWKLALGSGKEKSLSIVVPGLTSGAGLALQIAFYAPAPQRLKGSIAGIHSDTKTAADCPEGLFIIIIIIITTTTTIITIIITTTTTTTNTTTTTRKA
ncbi:hypothetical protein EK904_013392 [Melospiza melodia maxima]|nr:hypothetical protein EK904_013392 [Melospiza melodia maxima]